MTHLRAVPDPEPPDPAEALRDALAAAADRAETLAEVRPGDDLGQYRELLEQLAADLRGAPLRDLELALELALERADDHERDAEAEKRQREETEESAAEAAAAYADAVRDLAELAHRADPRAAESILTDLHYALQRCLVAPATPVYAGDLRLAAQGAGPPPAPAAPLAEVLAGRRRGRRRG